MAVAERHTVLMEFEEQGCVVLMAVHSQAVWDKGGPAVSLEMEVVLALDEDGEVICVDDKP
jgi:hypothetical protein